MLDAYEEMMQAQLVDGFLDSEEEIEESPNEKRKAFYAAEVDMAAAGWNLSAYLAFNEIYELRIITPIVL